MLYGYRHSFIVYIKTDDIYQEVAEEVGTRFDNSDYELYKPLSRGKYKKVIGLMKDKLGGKIMIEFVGLRAKAYSYFIDDGSQKAQKRVSLKENLILKITETVYKQLNLKIKQNRLEKKIVADGHRKVIKNS